MASDPALHKAMERVCHRWRKSDGWALNEMEEWLRYSVIVNADDTQLETAVSAFVRAKGPYALDDLLAALGKKSDGEVSRGCIRCASGFVELAIWRGEVLSIHNPLIVALPCACIGGGLVKDAISNYKTGDPKITQIYVSIRKNEEGVYVFSPLTSQQNGSAQRHKQRLEDKASGATNRKPNKPVVNERAAHIEAAWKQLNGGET